MIPVHLQDNQSPLKNSEIAADYGVSIIEDACHALGASYRDSKGVVHRVGSCKYSDMTVFSFHPIKSITTGEGGAITTNDEEIYKRLKTLRVHGTTRQPEKLCNEDMALLKLMVRNL